MPQIQDFGHADTKPAPETPKIEGLVSRATLHHDRCLLIVEGHFGILKVAIAPGFIGHEEMVLTKEGDFVKIGFDSMDDREDGRVATFKNMTVRTEASGHPAGG